MEINSKMMVEVIGDIAEEKSQTHAGIALGKSAIAARVAVELQAKWPDAPSASIWNIATGSSEAIVAGLCHKMQGYAGAEVADAMVAETLAKADSQASLAALIVDQCVSARAGYEIQQKRQLAYLSTEPALNK